MSSCSRTAYRAVLYYHSVTNKSFVRECFSVLKCLGCCLLRPLSISTKFLILHHISRIISSSRHHDKDSDDSEAGPMVEGMPLASLSAAAAAAAALA
jgi:hypothetical protein